MPYIFHVFKFTIQLDVRLSYISLVDVNHNEENDKRNKIV